MIIVITRPGFFEGEAAGIAEMLHGGRADLVHIRKPDADLKAVGEWVPRKVRRAMRKALKGKKDDDAETAAAISMALEAELGGETEVAIATALALHLGYSVHDVESGNVTIPRQASPWADKTLTFRRLPNR